MNKVRIALGCALALWSLSALQAQDAYDFKTVINVTATPVKNQEQTGTCWAFSTASFLESELQKMGKGEVNLSEMFVVRNIYRQKCENYVRRQGTAQFGQGGLAHDLINAVRQFGLVPEDVYPGRKDPLKPYNHNGIEKKLKGICDDMVAKGKKGELPIDWLRQVDEALDAEFGPLPGKFTVGGKVYTANLYRDFLGINPDDYVTLTSFTHHPMWQPFVLEIPDNFSNGLMYNVPIDDLLAGLNYALQQGYTACWDADVSNTGFSAQNGLAIVPAKDWDAKSTTERDNTFKFHEAQKQVTQEYRQELFDRQETTDDHLMQITGIKSEGKQADIYYTVKNSWGEISDLKGYLNASEQYLRLNTISLLFNKKALPLDLRQRLGLAPGELRIPAAPTPGTTPKSKAKVLPVKPAPAQNAQPAQPAQPVKPKMPKSKQ